MRTEEEVKAKFEDMRARRLAQHKEKYLSKYYRNCEHNKICRVKENGKLGFCQNEDVLKHHNGGPGVCDVDGPAATCPRFSCRNTDETVEADFEAILRSPARCGEKFPKLAILIWYLQDDTRRTRKLRLATAIGELGRALSALVCFRWW